MDTNPMNHDEAAKAKNRDGSETLQGPAETGRAGTERDAAARLRLAKIQEHLEKTLGSADSLTACLGPIACDLMEMALDLKRSIDELRVQVRTPQELLDELAPALELYLRLARQIERLAQIDSRRRASKPLLPEEALG